MATSSRPKRAAASSPSTDAIESPMYQDSSRQTSATAKSPSTKVRLRYVVRERLLDTIRKAIGREIVPKKGKPINPRQDDVEPPNLYKWQFSSDYPHFPVGGVTTWTGGDQKTCIEALDHGWLSVTALPAPARESVSTEGEQAGLDDLNLPRPRKSPSIRSVESVDDIPSEGPSRSLGGHAPENTQDPNVTSNILDAIRHHEVDELFRSLEEVEAVDDISRLQESCENVEHLILQREAALQDVSEVLKLQLRGLSDMKADMVNHAKTKIAKLEKTVKDQSTQYQQLQLRYEGLQREFISAGEEIADLKHKLEHSMDEVAEVRRLDELEDLRAAIQDLRKKRDAQEEEHLAQLKRAREESMQKGFRQGEASVTKKSNDTVAIADLKRQLEDMQARHSVEIDKVKGQATSLERQIEDMRAKHLNEVARAREEGRREDEELTQLLDVHNVNYHGRKRREIRAIYHNWKNVPQNIFPKSMIPEGITPSDRILLLLARLSRAEEDPQKATVLLEREIELRNAQSPEARRDLTLTSADIDKVLASFGDESSGQCAAEMSSTPQPFSQHVRQSTSDSDHSDVPRRPKRNTISANESDSCDKFRGRERENDIVSPQSKNCETSEYIESNNPPSRQSNINVIPWSGTSDSPNSSPQIRNPTPQNKPAIKSGDTISSRRTFHRRSLPNPETVSSDSQTRVPELAMMPAGATEIPDKELTSPVAISIIEEIESLPLPSMPLVPSALQNFPMDFVREFIRGDNATFSICGRTKRDKQVVNWPEMIKLNAETHPCCPSPGTNGALVFVDGRPNTGEIGKTYPTLLREKVGFYTYIGHYKVVKRIIMPVEIWKECTDEDRLSVVNEIENREWGQTLLTSKGLCTNATDKEEKRIDDLLGFFERTEEPYLRMSWTLIQLVSFEEEDYKVLVDSLKEYETEQEMEYGVKGNISFVGSNVTSRSVSPGFANQDANIGTQEPDQLQPAKEDLQTSTPKLFNNIPISISEAQSRPVNGNASRPAKVAIMCTPTASLDIASYNSPSVSKVLLSARSTIPSSTNDSDDVDTPEYLSEAEDGRWRIHIRKTPRIAHLTTPGPSAAQAESQIKSVPFKRQYEEEVDLYGVSPPAQLQPAAVAQVSIARPPNRTLQEILASFTNSKRRKIGDSHDNNIA